MTTYSIANRVINDSFGVSEYLDSDTLIFDKEDILITDPCYIFDKDSEPNGWERSRYGQDFSPWRLSKYVTHETLYGDWSCTVWDKDTGKEVGEFCADAGLVSIFSLDEVREKVNPDIEKWCESHSWCATIIRNFTGEVKIRVECDKWYDLSCIVVGNGSVNFSGGQTSL